MTGRLTRGGFVCVISQWPSLPCPQNIVDDFTRECVRQLIETSISGLRMSRFLDGLNRKPKVIVCDNGPELTSKAMFFWARDRSIKLRFIQPGKPTQNAFVESFNGKFRDYCLNLQVQVSRGGQISDRHLAKAL